MQVKKQKKKKNPSSTLTCYKDSRPSPNVSQYQLDAPEQNHFSKGHKKNISVKLFKNGAIGQQDVV